VIVPYCAREPQLDPDSGDYASANDTAHQAGGSTLRLPGGQAMLKIQSILGQTLLRNTALWLATGMYIALCERAKS
jgi:hypothetical protein